MIFRISSSRFSSPYTCSSGLSSGTGGYSESPMLLLIALFRSVIESYASSYDFVLFGDQSSVLCMSG
jgi:hypothetical protein